MKKSIVRPLVAVTGLACIVLVSLEREGWLSRRAKESSIKSTNFTSIAVNWTESSLGESFANTTSPLNAAAEASSDSQVAKTPGEFSDSQVATSPVEFQRRSYNISLIVKLKGELGNQLSVLAGARITQLIAAQKYPHLRIYLIGQHQNHSKWVRGRDDLVRCFPEFRDFVFEGGIYDKDFPPVEAMQKAWLNETEQGMLTNARGPGLDFLQSLLDLHERGVAPPTTDSNYSFPFLVADSFSWSDALRNEYMYEDLRRWMRFNESACCAATPDSTEIVFHHRNFMEELKERALDNHFSEVTPKTAANLLFANASAGSRIAIVSRFNRGLRPYVAALKAKGITARVVEGQTGVQDFCFLTKAQTELVGKYQSTFVRWASFVGNATVNRFYSLDQSLNRTHSQSVQTLDVIRRGGRSFIMEEYWQPSKPNNA